MTTLYRISDGAGRLLYIGITRDLARRIQSHRRTQSWWPDEAIVMTETVDDGAALDVEREAIKAERPIHNVTHRRHRGRKKREPRADRPVAYLANGRRYLPHEVEVVR